MAQSRRRGGDPPEPSYEETLQEFQEQEDGKEYASEPVPSFGGEPLPSYEETLQELVDETVLPPPTEPRRVAAKFLTEHYSAPDDVRSLHRWRGQWWEWAGPKWIEVSEASIRAAAYAFTGDAVYARGSEIEPWSPTARKISDLVDALKGLAHVENTVSPPVWLDGKHGGDVFIAAENGLLDITTGELLSHDPRFFNMVSVPFDYDATAPPPARWLAFLGELFGDDEESPALLAEWFGYVLSGRTDLQKIMLMVGPTRGGKGATARVLQQLVGPEHVAGPTLSSLSGDFGLAPLLGKPLAIVADARGSSISASVVVERLLSISGEDRLTVNVKYREQWSGKLPTRLMLLSNELPAFGDASAAIAGRFVTLLLTSSWLGKEDRELEPTLRRELPGILNWAMAGLVRLRGSGNFTRPAGAEEAYRALVDLASPVEAFVRDSCEIGSACSTPVDALYTKWKAWAEENGHVIKTKQVFGRDLRARYPLVKITQPGGGNNRERWYAGIR